MNKKGILWLVILASLILGLSGLLIYRLFFFDHFNEPAKKTKVVDRIINYNYYLEDRDSKLYKTKFNELKALLKSDDFDYEQYGSLLTELYIIDFYSLDNKLNKYDVGGLDFILESDQESFKKKAMATYYKNVKDNTYDNRKQKLPQVTKVNIINVEDTVYKKTNEGYLIDVSWEYDSNYDASNHANITLVKEKQKLVIAKIETIDSETE